jgi:hypothetical protein
MPTNPSRNALVTATVIATGLQVAMVVTGHFVPAVATLFAPLGTFLSLVAGVLYARLSGAPVGPAAAGGAVAGALCSVLGVAVSLALGDVPAVVLAIAAVSGIVAGAIGGAAAAFLTRRKTALA